MASKKQILNKIRIVLTGNFESPEEAFNFFDKNSDGSLSKKEIVSLLKEAEISGFLRGIVASKLVSGYDFSDNNKVEWSEFRRALKEMA
jgi:Ca2+-binding EF-hand superfamily protein